jgi:DNA-binding GntR family transcriptional regulator
VSKASQKAYQTIRALILSGEFAPGMHLKEEELAEKCEVSRTPIRDALRALAADDYVRVKPNHGTFVSSWSDDDIDEIFKLRAILEGVAAARAAAKASEQQIAGLKAEFVAIEGLLKNSKSFDYEQFLAANRRFHEIIASAANSQRLTTMIARLVEQPVVARTALSYRISDLKRSNAHHGEIIAAITAADQQWAEAVMQSHILSAHQAYKLHYEELGGDD